MTTSPAEVLALRAEFLKARGNLEDPNTGLPALASIVDDLRRRIEDGKTLGIVFLDLSAEEHLEEIYGWETYDGILKQVAGALKDPTAGLLEADDLVALTGVRSDQFLVFLVFDGSATERDLTRRQAEIIDDLMSRLRIQIGNEIPRGLDVTAASAFVRYDPTVRVERAIYRALDRVKARCLLDHEEQITRRTAEIRRILSARDIFIRYQPIVWMSNGSVFGFEALSCGPQGDLFENPEMLFAFAERTDQILDLERLCRVESVVGAARLPAGRKLFLNCSAHGIEDLAVMADSFIELADGVGLGPTDLVLEITERVAVTTWTEFRQLLDQLRERGFAVAIDDMGAGYSSLQSVAEVEPDFLKFDIALVRDIHKSSIKQHLLESLLMMAKRIDAQVIAEGVETEDEYEVLRQMRVPFGQGFFFSPPSTLAFHVPDDPARP